MKTLLFSILLIGMSACTKYGGSGLNNITAYRNDVSQAQVLDVSVINTNLTLSDRVNGVDYLIKNEIEVTANLSIKPGVTLMFEDGAGLLVRETGSLTATGTGENEIYFISKTDRRGSWKGITILSNSAANVISHCLIEHGGSSSNIYGRGNLILGSSTVPAAAEISNSTVTASDAAGLVIAEGSVVRNFTGNNIHTNTTYPVSLHITDAGSFPQGNTYKNNGKEFIELTGSGESIITKPAEINKLNEPYALTGTITGSNITIKAGTRIYLADGAQLTISGTEGNGSLTAIGTPEQPIVLSGEFNYSGMWNAINFESASSLSQLAYCLISDGGSSATGHQGMINLLTTNRKKSVIDIRHCTISNSAASGIYIHTGSTIYNSDIETANTFINNAGVNIYYDGANNGTAGMAINPGND